jgi:hypothetical protein
VRGSLLVLDVGLLLPVDASVRKFLVFDGVHTVFGSSGSSPVPVHSSHELKSCDLLVSQVGDDLKHLTTVTVKAEDLVMEKTWSVDSVLEE